MYDGERRTCFLFCVFSLPWKSSCDWRSKLDPSSFISCPILAMRIRLLHWFLVFHRTDINTWIFDGRGQPFCSSTVRGLCLRGFRVILWESPCTCDGINSVLLSQTSGQNENKKNGGNLPLPPPPPPPTLEFLIFKKIFWFRKGRPYQKISRKITQIGLTAGVPQSHSSPASTKPLPHSGGSKSWKWKKYAI